MNPKSYKKSTAVSPEPSPEPSRRYFLKTAGRIVLAAVTVGLTNLGTNEAAAQTDENLEFNRPHTFSEFPVEVVPTKLNIKPVLDDEFKRDYPTRIKAAMEQGTVFAGKFALAEIGNGTMGQFGFIIDMTNGKVHRLPGASLGYEFKIDSRLLIVNSKIFDDEFGVADPYPEEYWEWNGKDFNQLID